MEITMPRYINADKLALHLSDYALQESPNWGANGYGNQDVYDAINECIKAIDNQPTADAVEVVRCKDCKYYEDGECQNGELPVSDYSDLSNAWLLVKPDDYCSYGERAEE